MADIGRINPVYLGLTPKVVFQPWLLIAGPAVFKGSVPFDSVLRVLGRNFRRPDFCLIIG